MGTKRLLPDNTEGSIVIESTHRSTPPPLKLRIKHQTLSQKLSLDIYESKSDKDKYCTLLNFSKSLRLTGITADECEQLMRLFKELVKREPDHMLRAKVIELMAILCGIIGSNKMQIVEDILECLHKEDNHSVISRIFKSLTMTSVLIPNKSDVIQRILKTAIKKLEDCHQDVRCSCLFLISRICTSEPIKITSARSVTPLELFNEFSADQDPRVREVVFQSLLTLHQRGHILDFILYEKACVALSDDYEDVRQAAIMLIWVFSHTQPERLISSVCQPDGIPLMDDAFIKICSMVNDSSMKVRAKAVSLLSSLHNVSFALLEQTLDKKLMSSGKKTKSFNERASERFLGGDDTSINTQWNTGNTWSDNLVTINKPDEQEVQLMNTGACGVFVRALEDEYMEVRSAGIDSICELANQNAQFAHLSTDFLVDMFNDEIEMVRLNSITSLMKLHKYVDFREDQLDTVLECLNDFNQLVRDSVRELLGYCLLSTQACLHATVLALLSNLKKYPLDNESIWKCLKELGKRHSYFVSSLVPELLVTHPYYAVPEPNINDPSHIAIAALIFNAAENCSSIFSLLPSYTKQHYEYLRDSLPHLIPQSKEKKEFSTDDDGNVVNDFFSSAVSRMYKVLEMPNSNMNTSILSCIKDFQHIKSMNQYFSPAAEFLCLFLECHQKLIKCRNDRTWSIPAAMATSSLCSSLQNDVVDLMNNSYKLEFMYSGLASENVNTLRLIRILAHSLCVLLELRLITKDHLPKKVNLKLWGSFLQRLRKFKEHVVSTSDVNDQLKEVLKLQDSIEENISETSTLITVLQKFFLSYPINISVKNRLRLTHAKMVEPRSYLDTPLKFCAGLTLSVLVVAYIENVDNISDIQVKFW
ncbi:integrator complex subunit 4 isoform X2 [Hydra vulgaris]|uniref:Integrator complex subunit 4 isoform X2 n=1 Tax=Hydra vulgaris TaxID=6087 RepID=A0ABM4B857_HYDVU